MTYKRFTPDELADRLDAALPPNQDTVPAADADVLVNLAIQLARAPRPEMPPETFARIQAQVIQAHRQQQPMQRPALRLSMTPLMRSAAVVVIAVFFFGSAMIPAAASSLPGELFYPVKLGIEQIEVIAASSTAALSVVHLNHAERRLSEARILLERGQFESTLLIEGWESLAESTEIAEEAPAADLPFDLQARAAQVNVALNAVLLDAERSGIASPDEIRNIRVAVTAVEDNTPTATLDSAVVETATPVETSTHVPTATWTSSATPDTALTEVATPYLATVFATQGVNVRRGPGIDFEVITVVQPGSLVSVIGQNDDESWLYVRLDDSRLGWIAASLLRRGILPTNTGEQTDAVGFDCDHPGNYCNAPGYNDPGGNNSAVDFDCDHPGNYCNAPGHNNANGGNGDNGQGPGNGSANSNRRR